MSLPQALLMVALLATAAVAAPAAPAGPQAQLLASLLAAGGSSARVNNCYFSPLQCVYAPKLNIVASRTFLVKLRKAA